MPYPVFPYCSLENRRNGVQPKSEQLKLSLTPMQFDTLKDIADAVGLSPQETLIHALSYWLETSSEI